MNKEIWKAIPGYEDLYEASNRGRIRTKQIHYRLTKYEVVERQPLFLFIN